MASQECKLVTLLLHDFFGPVSASIADELKWGPKPLKLLSSLLKLPIPIVKQVLCILIHFNFVEFKVSEINGVCEYSLLPENVLLLTRYSKFILLARKRFSKEGEVLVQELLYSGKMTLTNLILKVTYTLAQGNSEMSFSLSSIKNSACELIENGFIVPVERVTKDAIPIPIKLTENEKIPDINIKKLTALYQGTDTEMPTNELFWRVNFDRFLVEFRDELLVNAMSRRFDIHAGVVMRHLLKLSLLKTDYWKSISTAVSMMQIRDSIGNDTGGIYALKYADQYIKVMEDDSSGFIGRSVDYSGAVTICMKDAIENLTSLYISQIVDQKFGFKAARVFRLVQNKKFCELEQIQQLAMLPDKEAKYITYKLLEENFIQMQELRKPTAGSSSGPNKAFFLFYVDINVIVRMVLSMCHKSINNVITRRREEENKQIHIVEKKKQADLMITALKDQGASEDQIEEMMNEILTPPEKILFDSLQRVTKRLHLAEMQIDETIFILQLYMQYNKTVAPEGKLKKRS